MNALLASWKHQQPADAKPSAVECKTDSDESCDDTEDSVLSALTEIESSENTSNDICGDNRNPPPPDSHVVTPPEIPTFERKTANDVRGGNGNPSPPPQDSHVVTPPEIPTLQRVHSNDLGDQYEELFARDGRDTGQVEVRAASDESDDGTDDPAPPATETIESIEYELAELTLKIESTQAPSTVEYQLWITSLTSLCQRSLKGLKRSSEAKGPFQDEEEGYDSAEEEADADIFAFLQTMQTPRPVDPKPVCAPVMPVPKLQLPADSNDTSEEPAVPKLQLSTTRSTTAREETSRGNCLHCALPVLISQSRCKCVQGYLHQKCVDLIRVSQQKLRSDGESGKITGVHLPHYLQADLMALQHAPESAVSIKGTSSSSSPKSPPKSPELDSKQTLKLHLYDLGKAVRIPISFKLSKLCLKVLGEIAKGSDFEMRVEREVQTHGGGFGSQTQVGCFSGDMLNMRLGDTNVIDEDIIYVRIRNI